MNYCNIITVIIIIAMEEMKKWWQPNEKECVLNKTVVYIL